MLLSNKSHNINAWVQYKTDGKFLSVAVVFDKTYVVVERNGMYSLEVFDYDYNLDCAKTFVFDEAVTTVSDLGFLNDKDVTVIADGEIYKLKVEDNEINLPKPCKNIVIGLP